MKVTAQIIDCNGKTLHFLAIIAHIYQLDSIELAQDLALTMLKTAAKARTLHCHFLFDYHEVRHVINKVIRIMKVTECLVKNSLSYRTGTSMRDTCLTHSDYSYEQCTVQLVCHQIIQKEKEYSPRWATVFITDL